MWFVFFIILIAPVMIKGGSVFERPLIIVRSEKLPFKVKPEQIWTVKPPNWDKRDFCIYEPKSCSDWPDVDHNDLLITDFIVSYTG